MQEDIIFWYRLNKGEITFVYNAMAMVPWKHHQGKLRVKVSYFTGYSTGI